MSSQTRIDHFFKSTSGKQQPVKILSRSKSKHKLPKTEPGNSTSFGNPSFAKNASEEKTGYAKHVTQDASVNLGRTQKSPADTSITNGQSNVEDDSNSADNITTPAKKTIRGFVKACNSPPVIFSREKIRLKRGNQDSPEMSGTPKIAKCFGISTSRNSSNLSECFEKTFDGNIVEVTHENSYKFHLGQTNVERRVGTCDKELRNGNNSIGKEENELNCQAKNIAADSQTNCEEIRSNITPKKRKSRDSSTLESSPCSGWNVAISIKTADVSMTALSSDWQKTFEASQELEKSLVTTEQRASKENVQRISGNGGSDETLSEKSQSTTDTRFNAYSKKTSPRRALFSPGNSAKKVRFEESEISNASLTNGTNSLPQGILKSTNSRVNGNCDPSAKINERPNLTKKMAGLSKNYREQNEDAEFLIKINESINSKRTVDEITNSCTKVNGIANSSTKVSNVRSSPTKIVGGSFIPGNMTCTLQTPTKDKGNAVSLIKVNGASSMLQNMSNSPATAIKANNTVIAPTNRNEHLITPTTSPSRSSKSSFSPRFKVSPKKPRKERIDLDLATRAVKNLNQTKQGIIPMNNFDLEMIYTKKSFAFEYGSLNANTSIKYEAKDVQVPEDKHADHFFMVLVNVFSEALNCGYFDEEELDTVFSTLTLRPDAQSLLARMLKRKRGWHRVSNIKYPEISDDLTPICKELVDNGFLDDDIAREDISKLLNVLQVDEIKAVCQAMKRPKATKPAMIADLVKLANTNTCLFPGIKSPSFVLRQKIIAALGLCIRLPERIENLLNRIFILLIPNQDPKENMVEAFRLLTQVHFGEKIFPQTPKERFPIFRNRLHLIRYAEARSTYTKIINASEAKDWDSVRTLGQLAHDNLKPYFESSDSSGETQYPELPSHVKRYDPNYLWIKVMSKSVAGFKKSKETMAIAAEFLHMLVSTINKMPANRTRWYNELAMIESYHRKNFEMSAEITLKALEQENISDMDAAEIFERTRKLCKSKAISANTKKRINAAVSLRQKMSIFTSEPTIKEIEATMVPGNTTGSKSTWSVNIGGVDTGYVKVENVALRHYLCQGFRNGIHCEGALPVTLFATLLWEEIYTVPVPGAFVSSYQEAPLDLYTSHFLEPRRERIENKLNFIRRLDLDSLSSMMHEDFIKYREYESLVHGNLFAEPDDFKDFIECLGMDAVVGICERLAGNYNQWKSGFPDLALWNPDTKKCKIVEVKGPGDSLSTKQKLWIQFLETLGVEVEVCVVKGTTKRYIT